MQRPCRTSELHPGVHLSCEEHSALLACAEALRALVVWESQKEVRYGARLHQRQADVAKARAALAALDAADQVQA